MKKVYTVYKTTNLINNTIYIGVHKTSKINDSYLGSGKLLKLSIKKYGKESFKKEILFIFDNPYDAYEKEKEIVNYNFICEVTNYNLAVGGVPTTDYFPNRKYLRGENHPLWGKKQTEESNKRRSLSQTGIKMSIKSSIKKSLSLKGHKSWNKGKELSEQDKLNKSIAAKKVEKIECPFCGKLNDPGNSKKWHFEKCKFNNNTLNKYTFYNWVLENEKIILDYINNLYNVKPELNILMIKDKSTRLSKPTNTISINFLFNNKEYYIFLNKKTDDISVIWYDNNNNNNKGNDNELSLSLKEFITINIRDIKIDNIL